MKGNRCGDVPIALSYVQNFERPCIVTLGGERAEVCKIPRVLLSLELLTETMKNEACIGPVAIPRERACEF